MVLRPLGWLQQHRKMVAITCYDPDLPTIVVLQQYIFSCKKRLGLAAGTAMGEKESSHHHILMMRSTKNEGPPPWETKMKLDPESTVTKIIS